MSGLDFPSPIEVERAQKSPAVTSHWLSITGSELLCVARYHRRIRRTRTERNREDRASDAARTVMTRRLSLEGMTCRWSTS